MSQAPQIPAPTDGHYSAFVVGATGNVGSPLVDALLASPRCARVTAIVRRPLERAPSPKLDVVVWEDFDEILLAHPERAIEVLSGHQAGFCCLGASKRDMMGLLYAPSRYREIFGRVDRDYVVGIATAARAAGVSHFSVISTPGANPDARFAYTRIKGEMEQSVERLGFESLSVFHPGTLVADARQREVLVERIFTPILGLLDALMPKKYRKTPVGSLARAMQAELERRLTDGGAPKAIHTAPAILEMAQAAPRRVGRQPAPPATSSM